MNTSQLLTGQHKLRHMAWSLGLLLTVGMSGQVLALDRLFVDDAERQMLDNPVLPHAPQHEDQQQTDHTPPSLRLNGYLVTRTPGQPRKNRKTFWVNGNMHDNAQQARKALGLEGINLLDEQGRPIRLRSGQTLDLHQRTIREIYQSPEKEKLTAIATEAVAEQPPSP